GRGWCAGNLYWVLAAASNVRSAGATTVCRYHADRRGAPDFGFRIIYRCRRPEFEHRISYRFRGHRADDGNFIGPHRDRWRRCCRADAGVRFRVFIPCCARNIAFGDDPHGCGRRVAELSPRLRQLARRDLGWRHGCSGRRIGVTVGTRSARNLAATRLRPPADLLRLPTLEAVEREPAATSTR